MKRLPECNGEDFRSDINDEHIPTPNEKKKKLDDIYDIHHKSIPHNSEYVKFMEQDIFRLVGKYFPSLRELKDKTPIPTPKSDQDFDIIHKLQNTEATSEKEKNQEKQVYAVQRKIAYMMADEVFKDSSIRCCPYCWLNVDYCICKSMIYPWRDNKHIHMFKKDDEDISQEVTDLIQHAERVSLLQESEPLLKFILLMHSKEFFRKSNTGKILLDSLPDGFVEIYLVDVDGHEQEFKEKYHAKGTEQDQDSLTFLLYPSEDALDLNTELVQLLKEKQRILSEKLPQIPGSNKKPIKSINLIIIDSIWQQAKHVLKKLCSKTQLPNRIKFDQSKVVHLYQQKEPIFNSLRKQTEQERTSTLECALLCMFLFDTYSTEFSKPLLFNLKSLIIIMHKMCHKALDKKWL